MERVDLARNVRTTRQAYELARAAAERATRLSDQLEGEARASLELDGISKTIGQRNLDLTRGRLAAEKARAQSRGSEVKLKEVAYQSALQTYHHRLSADARRKTAMHPRLVIDVQVEIDGVLQPTLKRLDPSLHGLVESPNTMPVEDNSALISKLEALDSAILDGKDPTSFLRAIEEFKRPLSNQAVLYAPLHEATTLEDFQRPTRLTSKTKFLEKKRDELRAEQRLEEAADVQRELDAIKYPSTDSKKVTKNIENVVRLLFDNEITMNGKKYVVGGHEWVKSKYRPFGFQIRRREVTLRVVQPPSLHVETFTKLLENYKNAIDTDVEVPNVSKEEEKIESFFVDNDPRVTSADLPRATRTQDSAVKGMAGVDGVLGDSVRATKGMAGVDGVLGDSVRAVNGLAGLGSLLSGLFQSGGGVSASTTSAMLSAMEAIVNAPSSAATYADKKLGITKALEKSALAGALYETMRSDPINPYNIFKRVLSDPTQYGTFRNIAWNTHIGRYVRIPTQEGRCRAFIYEYLAYRASIYNDFFKPTRYSGYADLPFMIGSRKNSELIHILLNTSFDPALQKPLTQLLQKWKEYDTAVYFRAASLMHADAVILRYLCREVLLRTLSDIACAINVLTVKLLMRQASACRNRDKSFECLTKLYKVAAKLQYKPLPDFPKVDHVTVASKSAAALKVDESPLLKALVGYKVNDTRVFLPVLEPQCPEVDKSKVEVVGQYITLLEASVANMKKQDDVRLYLSFTHSAPCADITHEILTSKLELYEERMRDMLKDAARPQKEMNRVRDFLEDTVISGAKNVLAGMKPFESEYEFKPDVVKYLTEFKCKSHNPPEFDPWYAELNKLHAVYTKDLKSLYDPVSELARVVHSLYETKDTFKALNQLDYAISAYELLVDTCSQAYATTTFTPVKKPRDVATATLYLRMLLDLMDGAPRSVPPPDIQLVEETEEKDNGEAVFKFITHSTAANLAEIDLRLPIRISAKKIWERYLRLLRDDQTKATEFLAESGDLKSNAWAAHRLYENLADDIRKHDYTNAVRSLRLILSFNVYSYNWQQFFKLHTFEKQREQLEFLLADITPEFSTELSKNLGARLESIQRKNREEVVRVATGYKKTIDARLKQVFHYMYVLNFTLGNREEATSYKRRTVDSYFASYYAAIDAKRAGQSVFDLRTTFRSSNEWTVVKLVEKVQKLTTANASENQAKLAFLMQFSNISWKDPGIDYDQLIQRLSPDHALSRVVQHVSTALFPDETTLSAARKLVGSLMYTYRKNPALPDDQLHGNALIKGFLDRLPPTESTLVSFVAKESARFAPSPKRAEVMEFIQRSVRARENLWPGEKKGVFAQFTENMPYLDGEYTINVVVRLQLLSETNELIVLKNKKDKSCVDKGREVQLLRQFLFTRPSSSSTSLPRAPK